MGQVIQSRRGGGRGRPALLGRELERAHFRAHGEWVAYPELAVRAYEELDSAARVAAAFTAGYGVDVSPRTVSDWINSGLAERARMATAGAEASDEVSDGAEAVAR